MGLGAFSPTSRTPNRGCATACVESERSTGNSASGWWNSTESSISRRTHRQISPICATTRWVLTALRHVRARESDLIYEAYYDAFRADLEEDLGDVRD